MSQLDDYSYYDDEGFSGYEITTIDPGSSILIGTLTFCVSLYFFLPCVLSLLNRSSCTQKSDSASEHRPDVIELENRLTCYDQRCSEQRKHGALKTDLDDSSVASRSSARSSASSVIGRILDGTHQLTGRRGQSNLGGRRNRDMIARRDKDLELRDTDGAQISCDEPSALLLLETERISEEGANMATTRMHSGKSPDRSQRFSMSRTFEKLLSIAELDYETRRIYKLALPYCAQALVSGVSQNGVVIIIGQLVGTRQLSAFAVVDLLVGLTSEAIGGIHESLIPLLGFSRGTENHKLTGEYLQLAIFFYVAFSIPFIFLWSFIADDVMLLFGFDEATAEIGRSFAVPYVWAGLFTGLTRCLHSILDVFDLELVSTVIVGLTEVATTLSVLFAALFWEPSLETIGFLYLIVSVAGMVLTMVVVGIRGWFRPYYCGLFHSLALRNTTAIKMMMKTAASLSAGYLLTYGEWEILAFFAGFLGSAEVAAWSILGTLWGTVENVTEAIADAAEVRVALLLGSGKPQQAEASAHKSIFVAFVFALVSTSIIFIAGDDLPTWLTTDPLLQSLIAELIPLFGIGNVALTMGTMAWTLVGAQNRYRLATCLGIAGSWLVTIPLSAVASILYRVDLQGQTAAVVVGYMASGFVTNIVLLRSDWKSLSDQVILYNATHDISLSDDSDDENDESSSSSSSDEASVTSSALGRSGARSTPSEADLLPATAAVAAAGVSSGNEDRDSSAGADGDCVADPNPTSPAPRLPWFHLSFL